MIPDLWVIDRKSLKGSHEFYLNGLEVSIRTCSPMIPVVLWVTYKFIYAELIFFT